MSIITEAAPTARSLEDLAQLHDRRLLDSHEEIVEAVRYVQGLGMDLGELVVIVADPQDWLGLVAIKRFAPPGGVVDLGLQYTMIVDRPLVAGVLDSTNKDLAGILRTSKPKPGMVRCVTIAFAGSSYEDIDAPDPLS